MPTIVTDDGARLNVQVDGPDTAPALMLSNSVGTDLHMWDDQVAEFAKHFRLIRYDRRGHGRSSAPPGPYSMERLGRDAIAILDALGIESAHWCGLSIGGMVGQWLGANAPERINKLVLSNTNYYYADKAFWSARIDTVRERGLASLVDANMQRWFTEGFRARAPQTMQRMTEMFLGTDAEGYVACCAAIRDMDFRESNLSITLPTLVIVGTKDVATPPAQGEYIAKQIKGAKLAGVEGAHIANVEQPKHYADTVLGFLKG